MTNILWKILSVSVVFVLLFDVRECGRSFGRSSGRSYSRPSYRPSPSYSSRPSPSHNFRPSPTHRPAPRPITHRPATYRPSTYRPATYRPPTYRPSTYRPPTYRPPSPTKPSGNNNNSPIGPPVTSRPLGNSNTGSVTKRPGSNNGQENVKPPPYGFKPIGAEGPPSNVKPVASAPPPGAPFRIQPPPYTPHAANQAPPAYSPARNPAGYGPPPPAYNPHYSSGVHNSQSYPHQYYSQGSYSPAGYHPYGGGVTVINNNVNHNYGGGHGGFGGGWSPSYYPYSTHETGSGPLGFFLGYSLGRMTTPTYHYSSFSYGYTPQYDHYTIHHYYHNSNTIPKESTIEPNTIIGCFGDSGSICPSHTTSLCTSNGAILCVASATTTVPCRDNTTQDCVKSEIPCLDNKTCQSYEKKTEIQIPCISTAKVYGKINYYNNTILINSTDIISATNVTNNTNATNFRNNMIVSNNNNTTDLGNSSSLENGTRENYNNISELISAVHETNSPDYIKKVQDIIDRFNKINVTSARNNFNATDIGNNSSLYNGTDGDNNTPNHNISTPIFPTLDMNELNYMTRSQDSLSRIRRDVGRESVNTFCVTILALPAKREPTEGEKTVKSAGSLFAKFLVKSLGANKQTSP